MTPRSATLLGKLLASDDLPKDRVAGVLDCAEGDLEALARGDKVMPLSAQMRLAVLILTSAPALSRQAHALKAQVTAATSYQRHETAAHAEPPGRWPKRNGR